MERPKGSVAVAYLMNYTFKAPKPVSIQVRATNEYNTEGQNVVLATQVGVPGVQNEQVNDGAVILRDVIRKFQRSRRVGFLEECWSLLGIETNTCFLRLKRF